MRTLRAGEELDENALRGLIAEAYRDIRQRLGSPWGTGRLDFVAEIAASWLRMAVPESWRCGVRAKSVFGLIGVLVPVLYCGGLLYYFLDVSGSVENAEDIGLGPTILGLAVIGLLFCIPLVVKSVRMFAGPRSPGASGRGGPNTPVHDGEGGGEGGPDGGIDADAVVARYMARRSAEASGSSAPPPTKEASGPARHATFGHRSR